MWRDIDPRAIERERPEPGRGRVGGGTEIEPAAMSEDPRDVFTRDLDLPRGPSRERVRANNREYRLSVMTSACLPPSVPFAWCLRPTFASLIRGHRRAQRATSNACAS
jgi:hypothetical protein